MSVISEKHYYQWILGTLSDYVSEPIADRLSLEIIAFGKKHDLFKENNKLDSVEFKRIQDKLEAALTRPKINTIKDLKSVELFNFIPKSKHSFKSIDFCKFIKGTDEDGVTQVTYGIKGNNAYSL